MAMLLQNWTTFCFQTPTSEWCPDKVVWSLYWNSCMGNFFLFHSFFLVGKGVYLFVSFSTAVHLINCVSHHIFVICGHYKARLTTQLKLCTYGKAMQRQSLQDIFWPGVRPYMANFMKRFRAREVIQWSWWSFRILTPFTTNSGTLLEQEIDQTAFFEKGRQNTQNKKKHGWKGEGEVMVDLNKPIIGTHNVRTSNTICYFSLMVMVGHTMLGIKPWSRHEVWIECHEYR